MAGRGNYHRDPAPSDPPEWLGPEGMLFSAMGPPSYNQARSQPTGKGSIMSNTVGGNRSDGDYVHDHFVVPDSQILADDRREQRVEQGRDYLEDAAESPAWQRTYSHVHNQVAYSHNYPDANEPRTSPSNYLYSSASATGSGSGSGSGSVPSSWGPPAGSSRAANIVPGHPTEQMEMEDPRLIAYRGSVKRSSRKSSKTRQPTGTPYSSHRGSSRHEQSAAYTHDTFPGQLDHQGQYHEGQSQQGQYPVVQYPAQVHSEAVHDYPQAPQPELPQHEQQYVAPGRSRQHPHSSDDRTHSSREGCCVIL